MKIEHINIMESCYTGEFGSVNSILNSFSTDMFESITFVLRPVTGGIDYLRSMRQSYLFQKGINKISNLDYEQREKILDAFTDLVATRTNDKNFVKDLEKTITELDEIKDIFKDLHHQRVNMNTKQMHQILNLSLQKLNGRIVSIRDVINSEMWNVDQDIDQLLVLNQVFYLIQETTKEALKIPVSKTSDSQVLNKLVFSLIYVEAFHRGKVTFDDFQVFHSFLSLSNYIDSQNVKDNDAVFEVLAL
ncbi:hypothetical protein HWN40_10385 [Methanolobus zinderi]|uniref:Uncharacterized protein n=1 Tax=Methanolobus zinderi TaxID=536044 RepID=A0A7D5I1L1_9EURY|nr:hypothetical protein [Methanolobus zinderi]QLC50606.1 hypothetical protein HWN40_10385 [Methanolobus zinderi]